ncbi:sushi, nidogen and EGF-like domain-containing protein 1 [Anneissia japonica]|uniref:sushi, nidogen and EGF-like domain-containing protein 1 n=1 Tax=Anneissia japonica TaxID=1529436 RepID=UPI0014258D4A|nr:sushi, nidogen and EGF-like domain-containing protein 1 [Anneissia japonica]
MVAPFWANVDLENRGYVYYRQETDEELLQRFNEEIHEYFVDYMDFKAKFLIIATWLDVGFYGEKGNNNPRNTFQLVVGTDEFETFSMFNYQRIDWTAGTESEGSPDTGKGGTAAQVNQPV